MESGNTNTNAETDEVQQRKPYTTPQLIEHGTAEKITGFDSVVGHSGTPA
jgi:hypothetical protein